MIKKNIAKEINVIVVLNIYRHLPHVDILNFKV